jgi:hypothetical protein
LGRAQRPEGAVHLVLATRLARRRTELRVPYEPVAQRREGEGLQYVLDDPERHPLAHDRQIPRRGDGDDVRLVPGGAQAAQELEAVAVREVEVEQDEVDPRTVENTGRLGP